MPLFPLTRRPGRLLGLIGSHRRARCNAADPESLAAICRIERCREMKTHCSREFIYAIRLVMKS
jgi:hypothetical protein